MKYKSIYSYVKEEANQLKNSKYNFVSSVSIQKFNDTEIYFCSSMRGVEIIEIYAYKNSGFRTRLSRNTYNFYISDIYCVV